MISSGLWSSFCSALRVGERTGVEASGLLKSQHQLPTHPTAVPWGLHPSRHGGPRLNPGPHLRKEARKGRAQGAQALSPPPNHTHFPRPAARSPMLGTEGVRRTAPHTGGFPAQQGHGHRTGNYNKKENRWPGDTEAQEAGLRTQCDRLSAQGRFSAFYF